MRRSRLLILIALLQSALAAFWLIIVAYLWSLMGNTAQFGKDAEAVRYGLKTGLVACGTFALLGTVAAVGMWKARPWGRWVAVFGSGFPAAMMLMDLPDWLHHPQWDDIAIAAVLSLWAIFLALPIAGRAFKTNKATPPKLEIQEN